RSDCVSLHETPPASRRGAGRFSLNRPASARLAIQSWRCRHRAALPASNSKQSLCNSWDTVRKGLDPHFARQRRERGDRLTPWLSSRIKETKMPANVDKKRRELI